VLEQNLPTEFSASLIDSSMSDTRLFVGNLSYRTLENELLDHFSQAGVVTSANIMLDKFTGKSRGFGFVEYSTPEEAAKAVEMFHNKDFQGRALTVNVAQPREDRPPRAGGARGGDCRREGGNWRERR
jgi:RNA recognition motif-containing protein